MWRNGPYAGETGHSLGRNGPSVKIFSSEHSCGIHVYKSDHIIHMHMVITTTVSYLATQYGRARKKNNKSTHYA